MERFFARRKHTELTSDGLLTNVDRAVQPVTITFLVYDTDEMIADHQTSSLDERTAFVNTPGVTWLDVDGVHQHEILTSIAQHAGLHPLVLEDVHNTHQRPKFEDFGDYLYMSLKMISWDEALGQVLAEQSSLILGKGYVLSFKEDPGDIFDEIRLRLREGKGRIRKMGADYLAYSLLDRVVDNYFLVLENLGEQIEDIEETLVTNPDASTLQRIYTIKRELIYMRKSVWPLREAINRLERGESPLLQEDTLVYLRDVYDHTIQVIDTIETFRDMVSGMLDIYLSSLSNRMNEVMKVLTIISTIFIPLSFFTGLYGMNFAYMPELRWRWGYFALLGFLVIVFTGMLIFFKRKKWF